MEKLAIVYWSGTGNTKKRWASVEEAAEWIYFVTVVNRFATGQLFEIDGGENSCPESTFIWI